MTHNSSKVIVPLPSVSTAFIIASTSASGISPPNLLSSLPSSLASMAPEPSQSVRAKRSVSIWSFSGGMSDDWLIDTTISFEGREPASAVRASCIRDLGLWISESLNLLSEITC